VHHIKTPNNTEVLLVASKDTGLEVNAEKTKYIFMSCEQNSGQNHNIMTGNKSVANETKFKHLETTLIHSFIHSFIHFVVCLATGLWPLSKRQPKNSKLHSRRN